MSESIFRKDGTAQGVAKQRLIETLAKPEERIINDPYADRFVLGASFIKFMGHSSNYTRRCWSRGCSSTLAWFKGLSFNNSFFNIYLAVRWYSNDVILCCIA